MSAPYNPDIDVEVARGTGLHLQISGHAVDDAYGAMVMAELAVLREDFPQVRVDVQLRSKARPSAADMARLINVELNRNEIWE
jgi:hypothetical protein